MSLFVCDRCGVTYFSEKKAIEWTGAVVCRGPGTNQCWEPRHPQDFVRARKDDQSVDNARPRGELNYLCEPIYEYDIVDLSIYVPCG